MERFFSFAIVLLAFVVLSSCEEYECEIAPNDNAEVAVVEAGFTNDADGWTIVGDAQGGFVDASYYAIEGLDNSGYIFAEDDVAGGIWFFSAPQKLLGNLSAYFGGTMSYWLIQESAFRSQFEYEDVVLEGNGARIYYKYEEFPQNTWTQYVLTLDASDNWFNENEEPASNSEIRNVLSNVTNLYIRGEFEGGADRGGLDQFELRTE